MIVEYATTYLLVPDMNAYADEKSLVEVRVLTYRRPDWLKRALESLIAQTHGNWIALVFDDSPDCEGREVVQLLGDARIRYNPNPQNLGCAGNLDKGFRTAPYVGGKYAFALEDDNVLYPEFIERNIECAVRSGCGIVQRNQETWYQSGDRYENTGGTTFDGNWREGVLSEVEHKAMLFLGVPISNGGLFWRTDIASELAVGNHVQDGQTQEYARGFQIVEPIYAAMEPLAKYTTMDTTTRGGIPLYAAMRFRQRMRLSMLRRYGRPLREAIEAYAAGDPARYRPELALMEAFHLQQVFRNLLTKKVLYFGRSLVLPFFERGAYPGYWSSENARRVA